MSIYRDSLLVYHNEKTGQRWVWTGFQWVKIYDMTDPETHADAAWQERLVWSAAVTAVTEEMRRGS